MKSKTPSFILELPLKTNPAQESTILVRLDAGRQDVGTSTIAMVGDKGAELKQFCGELIPKQKEKRTLQRKLDRQRRANNPDNYNENGTVKKGRKKWKKSNRYRKTQDALAELDRTLAAHRKSLHGKDINEILTQGIYLKSEKLSYKSFQKLWGKSIMVRAPSMFMNSLKRKAENAGGFLKEFPTKTTKLSQACHICGEYHKKSLDQRWHTCCGLHVQRDLYSAFLAKCVDIEKDSLDIERARKLFPSLEPILSEAVSRVKQTWNLPTFSRGEGSKKMQAISNGVFVPHKRKI